MLIDGFPFRELQTVKDRVLDAEDRLRQILEATSQTSVLPPGVGEDL